LIRAVFDGYPRLEPFFAECRRRCVEARVLVNCFGRPRRFPVALDRVTLGDFERKAQNCPIQSMVADALDVALANMRDYRREHGSRERTFSILLQIHDAGMFEAPYRAVEWLVEEVIPACLVRGVEIWPTTLDGEPTGKGPYHLGVETEVSEHWSEKCPPGRLLELGVSPAVNGFRKHGDRWYDPVHGRRWTNSGWEAVPADAWRELRMAFL
jgi:hypothetical protein